MISCQSNSYDLEIEMAKKLIHWNALEKRASVFSICSSSVFQRSGSPMKKSYWLGKGLQSIYIIYK